MEVSIISLVNSLLLLLQSPHGSWRVTVDYYRSAAVVPDVVSLLERLLRLCVCAIQPLIWKIRYFLSQSEEKVTENICIYKEWIII